LPIPGIYISATDLNSSSSLKELKSKNFFSKDLAIFQDQSDKWQLHNPIENKVLGEIYRDHLYSICQEDSIVKNVRYPDKLLFINRKEKNTVYSIDQ